MTRGNIEYNFEKSNFIAEINNFKFVFSSKLHLEKFNNRIIENRKKISVSLSDRFNLYISADTIADIILYTKIEQRGFLIIYESEKITKKFCKLQDFKIEVLEKCQSDGENKTTII